MSSIKVQTRRWADTITHQRWMLHDTYAMGSITHLNTLMNDVFNTTLKPSTVYGSHFLFNTPSNSQLGSDGYDNYQAPLNDTGAQLYKRRMWVGGSLTFNSSFPKVGDNILCTERISSVRCLGSNAFVTISRDFKRNEQMVMKEIRMLLYTNEPFRECISKAPLDSYHLGFSYVTTLKVSLSQLMRFNALSYNLHKIHYDAKYSQQENLRNVVVSGPFLVSVMLRFFKSKYPQFSIKDFRYKNTDPCYIDEEVTLGIKETCDGYVIDIMQDGRLCCSGTVNVG